MAFCDNLETYYNPKISTISAGVTTYGLFGKCLMLFLTVSNLVNNFIDLV